MNKNELLYKWLQWTHMEKGEVLEYDLKGSDEDDCSGYIKMLLKGKNIELKVDNGFRSKTFVFENNEKKEVTGHWLRKLVEAK